MDETDFNPWVKNGRFQRESWEQCALMRWVDFMAGKYPELGLLYHVPNGGRRDEKEAANLKRQGVKPGVPDLCLPVARGKYHGLYVELKVGKNTTTPNQKKWIDALRHQGYFVDVCYGWNAAADTIENYLKQGEFGYEN